MKNLSVLSLSVAVALASAGSLLAEELKSGPQSGDAIGAFNVTKVAGASDDGVEIGKNLCYRCRNGARPQVIVFTRTSDNAKVQRLVRALDKAVANNEESKLAVFVNILGGDKDEASDACKKLATVSEAKNVPFVVPDEFENGPGNYGINAKADVTVVIATDSKVTDTLAFASAKDINVQSVLKGVKKIVN